MQASTELIQKARQHAQRKYTMAMEKIVTESQDKLTQERARMTAKGSVLSGGMWKITARNRGELIESLIRVRLESLLDAFELYGCLSTTRLKPRFCRM